jgi:hypothetical protein
MQMVQKWIGVALIRLVKNLQKYIWIDALPCRSLKMTGIQCDMQIFRRCVEKHQHCSCYSFTLYLPFVLIALRSQQVLNDHPLLSDGLFNFEKAEAREFMYCKLRGQEPEEEKREPVDGIKRKRRHPLSGQAEGAAPSRFSKRLAVRATASINQAENKK